MRDFLITRHKFSQADVDNLYLYAAAFFTNAGNYRAFGDSKFIPDVPQTKLATVTQEVLGPAEFHFYNSHCFPRMYDYTEKVRLLGYFPPRGTTSFFSTNCTEEDGRLITAFLISKNIEAFNHRVLKTIDPDGRSVYEIRFASAETTDDLDTSPENIIGTAHVYEGSVIKMTRGDYRKLLAAVNEELREATNYPRNGQEADMLNLFIKSFEMGSLQHHRQANRIWIRDKLPFVECHFGFVERHRDPAGGRASFEGFAATVTNEMTNRLMKLVQAAPQITETFLPWPRSFNVERELSPDFTSLNAIAFSGHSIYSGVNLPHYSEVTQNECFKSILFSNHIIHELVTHFFTPRDSELLLKHRVKATEAQVIFRELFGHGTGKELRENRLGKLNFRRDLVDPLTGRSVSSWYKPGQTYENVFGKFGSSMEECRADAVGILLTLEPYILKYIGVPDTEAENVAYANCLSMMIKGLVALKTYDVKNKVWGNPHARAHFVILNVLQQKVPGFVFVREVVDRNTNSRNLELAIDRAKLVAIRKPLREFALRLHVFKSTADFQSAEFLYDEFSDPASRIVSLNKKFSDIRHIVDQVVKEKPLVVQPNTLLRGSEAVMISYEPTVEGLLRSFMERFNKIEEKYTILKDIYVQDMHHFPWEASCSSPTFDQLFSSPSSQGTDAKDS
ncbi:dipeptidyl peptidase 3 [Galendromus occidentalis]|uniref:Dipeptidyl peptidase 3 n=1 Tax=Galendromus occidentalis TaxID=34638 RepID=A0AAJ6QWL2_9ACAR|nr:dipeptidyl peptidase 3 [Galendromus occidentalis]